MLAATEPLYHTLQALGVEAQQATVLTLRYAQEPPCTFKAIGADLGCSKTWANVLHARGLRYLRHPVRRQAVLDAFPTGHLLAAAIFGPYEALCREGRY